MVTARVSKILIVDDTPHNIDVLSATLSDEHCELMAATSGARALELAARGRPDLVLVVVAGLWLVSLMFVGSARASFRREPIAVPAE